MSHNDIREAIFSYAKAYEELQRLQETTPWISAGDQKTGSIGEYYAFVYLLSRFEEDALSFGGHSEKGWDIEINQSPPYRVQVKTVSAFSKTRVISPIHRGWDELLIIFLSKRLEPEGLWIVRDQSIFGNRDKIQGAKCRVPGNPNTGSAIIPFGHNHVGSLRSMLDKVIST